MKLRTLIFCALVLVSVLPVGILAYWQMLNTEQNEFSVVENQHKVIAENLTAALERYATDLRSAFQLTSEQFQDQREMAGLERHLRELFFRHVCSIDAQGNIHQFQCALTCPQNSQFPQAVLASLEETIIKAQASPGSIHFSNIVPNGLGKPAIFLIKHADDGNMVVGEVTPQYLVNLQRGVAFGEKGHAAIVDQTGHVIAHPKPDWTESMKDLSGVSVVQKKMKGENGVARFYSPAVMEDMVAGYNVVPQVGWGVMVPQPQSEIFAHADSVTKAALTIAILGIIAASFLGWWISGILSNPMQSMADAAQAVARGDLASQVQLTSRLRPIEIRRLQASFNQMIDDVGRKNTVLINLAHEAVVSNDHKSAFISSMNHELRTPMNAVLGFAQLLQSEENLSENQKTAIENILRSGNHLLDLIDQMLDLNTIEAGTLPLNMEEIPARDVFQESIHLVQSRAHHERIEIIDKTEGQTLPLLWTDSTRLIQVLLNLLSNAVKYNREGGSVTLSCQQVSDEMLRINVSDTGIGINAEMRDKIFEPFERLGHEMGQIEGSGIGLSITKQIVELLGGKIGFHSIEGEGSTFWVDIRLSENQPLAILDLDSVDKTALDIPEENTIRTRRVLYIEDNPDNIRLVEAILGEFDNVELLTAENAIVGYDISTSKRPDLILMDINLPGMNGIQALKRLQDTSETRNIPVIAVTSNTLPKDVEAGLKAGFEAYITKPIKVSEFIDTISQTLNYKAA